MPRRAATKSGRFSFSTWSMIRNSRSARISLPTWKPMAEKSLSSLSFAPSP